ncbi:hypothetical protein [Streptomyces ipomoeae]|uniref:hypothetical protein n=1 Tax=Streptomyces ipomoeae TaxID=103232 RepID=UPI0029B746E7|nr:hypothetical protein [Streptomyces ipomoeae]MDX2692181.1 hypothetical protein [Streptomyces ipomoeae]MDX2839288.1 hypothetical protein [Streptomyces ipomoeae]
MTDLHTLLGGSTPENNLAEEYARVVDHFGRIAGAIEDGNLHYAWDKVSGLRSALDAFEARLGKEVTTDGETVQRFTGQNLDGAKVATAAAAFARSHRAGRLLHPAEQIKDAAVRQAVLNGEERSRRFFADFEDA